MQSMAYASWLKNWALGKGVCIYTYQGGTPSISEEWAPWLSPGGTGGMPSRCGVGSGVCCLSGSRGGAPVLLRLQCVWGFRDAPFGQWLQTFVLFPWSIACCFSIAAFTFLCPGNTTPRFSSSQSSAHGFLIRYRGSSIADSGDPPLAILAILKARRKSDCSSCTRPPCLAIVADMVKTYKILVAASTSQIWLLSLLFTVPPHSLRWLRPVLSTRVDAYHDICPWGSRSWQHHDVQFG